MTAATLDMERICRRIRSWMTDTGMSWDDLATAVSGKLGRAVSTSTIRSWLYRSRSLGFKEACAIADVFGKSLDELACRDEGNAA